MDKINYYKAQAMKELDRNEILNDLERKTHVPKLYTVIGLGAVSLTLMFFNVGASLITNIVGFAYPAYASFKAIENQDKDDDKLWLTYWVIYSFLNVLEYFADWLLFWVPFYFVLKLGFLVYLFNPKTKGAEFIYNNFIRQFVRHEVVIDKKIKEYSDKASDKVKEYSEKASDNAKYAADKMSDKARDVSNKASDNAKYAADKVKDAADKASNKTKDAADKASDKVKDFSDKASDNAKYAADKASDKVKDFSDKASDNAKYAVDNAKYTADKVSDNAKYTADRVSDNAKYAADKMSDKAKEVSEKARESMTTQI